jgi:shikimate kinase/3-dehydroquinate synthase
VSRPAIVFIGFMGAGKSTALEAACEAGLETTEIDSLMEADLGMPIEEAFERHGEEGFREREAEVVGALLERADGGAIALGGGSVLSERVRDALDRHIVVLLEIDAAEAWRRIEGTGRPLATGEADLKRLLAERLPLYEELADAVVPTTGEGVAARALPAIRALAEMPSGTRLLWASSASGDYPVFVGRDLLGTDWWPLGGRRLCVTDRNAATYSGRLKSLSSVVEIEPGEKSKTLDQAGAVIRRLAQQQMTREDHVVALGGGVVGDLAGFCAHVYQRGVPVVQVPTSLVAQVDSAYGGKTGVDIDELKNYAGAYHLPAAVIADTSTLTSLPAEHLAAGFVEVIKTGLLAGGSLWRKVLMADLDNPMHLEKLVFDCARYKCKIVAADERDGGLRHVLNLGHTVGHAIEGVSDYSYLHGEAIGLGLITALKLSGANDELRGNVHGLLASNGLPTNLDLDVSVDAILNALQRDKKRTAAGVGFVLLSEPGQPRTGQIVDPAKVRAAVEELY